MGAHLIGDEFQSDKYPTTPRGKVPLSVRDPSAQDLLWTYAQRRRAVDAEFSDDLEAALRTVGYKPPAAGDLARAEAVEAEIRVLNGRLGRLSQAEEHAYVRLHDEVLRLDVPDARVAYLAQGGCEEAGDEERLAREVLRWRSVGCASASVTIDGAGTPTASPPSERERHLRSTLRKQVAYYLQEDLEGGELFKETWEVCRDRQDREVVRDELRVLLRWLWRSLLRSAEGRVQTP